MNKDVINNRIYEHYKEAISSLGSSDNIMCVLLQGSQNYGLAYENSDIDSKALILPDIMDIVGNKKALSTTHIMPDNDEHVDFKDIRLMFECFKKQNINFVEILFTDYYYINDDYKSEFEMLRENAELIARYNPYVAVKCMKGMTLEKLHALKHAYPSKTEILKQYGYDPKQLHHIFRLNEFIQRYIDGVPYKDCLCAVDKDNLVAVKRGKYSLNEAEYFANTISEKTVKIADEYCEKTSAIPNKETGEILDMILARIIKKKMIKDISADDEMMELLKESSR